MSLTERQAMVRFSREVTVFQEYLKSFNPETLKRWPMVQECLEDLTKEINRARNHKISKSSTRRKAMPAHVPRAEVLSILPLD